MKSKDLLILGAIIIGGYAAYKLLGKNFLSGGGNSIGGGGLMRHTFDVSLPLSYYGDGPGGNGRDTGTNAPQKYFVDQPVGRLSRATSSGVISMPYVSVPATGNKIAIPVVPSKSTPSFNALIRKLNPPVLTQNTGR